MYADDTSLCHQSNDLAQLNEAINNDLKQLETWLQGNKLSLNVAKTHAMLVSTKKKHSTLKSRNEDLQLKIREHDLQVVQKTKYLGVQIDCNLDWKEQIKAVSTKASRAFEACQIIPSKRIFENSLHEYRGAPLSILLFCLGLYRLN